MQNNLNMLGVTQHHLKVGSLAPAWAFYSQPSVSVPTTLTLVALLATPPRSIWDKMFNRNSLLVKPASLPVLASPSSISGTATCPVSGYASVPAVSVFPRPEFSSVPIVVNFTTLDMDLGVVHDKPVGLDDQDAVLIPL